MVLIRVSVYLFSRKMVINPVKEQTTFEANGWLVNFVGVQLHMVISHNIEVV